jgi:hypothetical protein
MSPYHIICSANNHDGFCPVLGWGLFERGVKEKLDV